MRRRPSTVETRRGESSHSESRMQRKPSAGEVTRSPECRKPDSKIKLGRKLRRLSLRLQKSAGEGRRPLLPWLEARVANKILISLRPRVSFFRNPHPMNRQAAVGASEGLWQGLLLRVSPSLHYLLGPVAAAQVGRGPSVLAFL